jgi:ribosome-associated translation inhibitor RaiA
MEEDNLQLGGNIELSGFGGVDGGMMIILKKIIGNYARKMSDHSKGFESISLRMKTVHDSKYEIHAKLMDNGKAVTSSAVEHNVFVAVDSALKKIMHEIGS